MSDLTVEQKKKIVLERICRVLTSKKDEKSECILGVEAQRIVDFWFVTPSSAFGGKKPIEALDKDFDKLMEYVEYLDRNYLHENFDANFFDGDTRCDPDPCK